MWGGFKDNAEGRADAADRMALELIEETVGMLKQIGVESKVTLYFADLHAISPFFGRDLSYVAKSDNYRADMLKLADGIGFEFVPVTEAVYGFSMYNLKRALDPKKYPKEGLIYLGKGVEGELIARGKGIWDNLNQEAKDEVLRAIGRYTSPEVRKEKGEEWLAILYLGNRAFEGAWIGEVHRGGVFFSYGRPLYEIQPGYTIFWHSLKGGINKPPWFIDAEKELK